MRHIMTEVSAATLCSSEVVLILLIFVFLCFLFFTKTQTKEPGQSSGQEVLLLQWVICLQAAASKLNDK